MNPIKFCLSVVAAIIMVPLAMIVALAWLAVWLTPEQQPNAAQKTQFREDIPTQRVALESKTVQADSVFIFVI